MTASRVICGFHQMAGNEYLQNDTQKHALEAAFGLILGLASGLGHFMSRFYIFPSQLQKYIGMELRGLPGGKSISGLIWHNGSI